MSDMGDTTAPEQAATDTPQSPSIDLGPLSAQLDQLSGRFAGLEARIPQPAEPEVDEYADIYGLAPQLGLQPQTEDDPQEALRALAQLGDQRAQQYFEKNVSPEITEMRREWAEMRAQRDVEELQTQYPKLRDSAVHDAVAQKLQGVMQGLPQGVPATKQMVELAYRAWEADQMVTGEGSGTQQHQLENPAGAAPEGSEQSWNDRLMGGGSRSKGASFWNLRT